MNAILDLFNNLFSYLRENWWPICVLLVIGYTVKDIVLKYLSSDVGYSLTSTTSTTGTSSTTIEQQRKDRDAELREIRQRQQEIAYERAKEAAIVRKKKEDEERERRNNVAKEKKSTTTKGDKLGKPVVGSKGYNPLQPWSSSSGGGYKATKRTTRRG